MRDAADGHDLQPSDWEYLHSLKQRGFVVVVFTAREVGNHSARELRDRLIAEGEFYLSIEPGTSEENDHADVHGQG
jgi:hypothetical protein